MSHVEYRRADDDPWKRKLDLAKEAINGIGFPVLVCIWLGYQQFIEKKEDRRAMNEVKEVLASVKASTDKLSESIDTQNRILRRRGP